MSKYLNELEALGINGTELLDQMEALDLSELFETGSLTLRSEEGAELGVLSLNLLPSDSLFPLIQTLLDRPAFGSLPETFMLEALRYYSEKVAESSPTKPWDGVGINPMMWRQFGIIVQQKLRERFGN